MSGFLYEVPRKFLILNMIWKLFYSASNALRSGIFRFSQFIGKAKDLSGRLGWNTDFGRANDSIKTFTQKE